MMFIDEHFLPYYRKENGGFSDVAGAKQVENSVDPQSFNLLCFLLLKL